MPPRDTTELRGTTLRVYRYLFKLGRPAGIREVQRGLGLSSPSVAEYHLRKLVESGLIRNDSEGYVVERVVWDNMIRMRRTVIPVQAFYVIFFAAALLIYVVFFNADFAEGYRFGLGVFVAALLVSVFELVRTFRQSRRN